MFRVAGGTVQQIAVTVTPKGNHYITLAGKRLRLRPQQVASSLGVITISGRYLMPGDKNPTVFESPTEAHAALELDATRAEAEAAQRTARRRVGAGRVEAMFAAVPPRGYWRMSVAELRRLRSVNHPDKHAGADLTVYRAAVAELDRRRRG